MQEAERHDIAKIRNQEKIGENERVNQRIRDGNRGNEEGKRERITEQKNKDAKLGYHNIEDGRTENKDKVFKRRKGREIVIVKEKEEKEGLTNLKRKRIKRTAGKRESYARKRTYYMRRKESEG